MPAHNGGYYCLYTPKPLTSDYYECAATRVDVWFDARDYLDGRPTNDCVAIRPPTPSKDPLQYATLSNCDNVAEAVETAKRLIDNNRVKQGRDHATE